jgi:anthranilate synthase component 1
MQLNRFPGRDAFRSLARDANVIPVGAEVLADFDTPVSVLARFLPHNEPVFLLESVEGGERWGRFSVLGLSARTRLTLFRDAVVLRQGMHEERIPHHGDPLAIFRSHLHQYRLARPPGTPRFCGGLVGYLAYEAVHFFEPHVPNRLPAEKPLADFIIPDALIVFDNIRHTLTALIFAFLPPSLNPDAAYQDAEHRLDALLQTLAAPPPPASPPPIAPRRPHTPPQAVMPPDAFCEMVAAIKRHIVRGDVIQTVVSQEFVGTPPSDLLGLYRAQRFVNPSPYMYFLRLGDTVLAGSSPETMVRLEQRTATLRPIAGTRPRGGSEQEDRDLANALLRDEKERAEHLMLVDLGRNELGRVALPGTVQVSDLMVVERYSHVMHLVSNITAELAPDRDAFDLLRATFPAGTLTGAPKVRAMELIAQYEATPRGPYGGAVGYIAFDGNMDFAICIRTAHIEAGRLTIRAGAGIVADSVPESERLETVNKARAVIRALELLTPPEPTP